MTYGFLRETEKLAEKAGADKATGLHRTGLEKYLEVIFPDVDDWVHDKCFPVIIDGKKCRKRPDYRSDALRLIVEFDGLPHYQNPDTIIKDEENEKFYRSCGYKVIRIPYFIQLTNKNVFKLFGVKVNIPLFPEGYISLTPEQRSTPAFLCPLGIKRMASVYKDFPGEYLKQFDDALTSLSYLEAEIEKF